MKLFTKISLIVAAIAMALGIVCICVGLAMGAGLNDLDGIGIDLFLRQQNEELEELVEVKNRGNIRDDLEEEVEDIIENNIEIVGDEIEDFIENNIDKKENIVRENSHHGSEERYHNRYHNEALHSYSSSLQDIERLKVDVNNAKITIFAVEDADTIIYYSDRKEDISKINGSTFKIEDNSSLQNKIELEIYVPIGILNEIEIEAVACEFTADKMVADNISIEIDNATVQVDELVVSDKAELQINAGQMVIGYYDGAKLEAECAMGTIMVVCEGSRSNYNYDLECGMGNIRINEDSYSGIGEDIRLNNGSKKSIKAECGMGEILLEFPNSL